MTNLLSLSTIAEHATIELTSKKHPGGKLYEVVNLSDLGPYEYALIVQRNAEMQRLAAKKKLTELEKREIAKARQETVKMLVPSLEPAVVKELTDKQQDMIVFAWAASVAGQESAEGNQQSRRTTSASSRGSKRSTAATRKRGSTRRTG